MKDCSGLSSLREATADLKSQTDFQKLHEQTEHMNCQHYFKFALLGGITPKTMMLIYLFPRYGVTGKQLVLFKLFTISMCVLSLYLFE